MTDTIEIDREKLKQFAHQNYLVIADFYPTDEYAEATEDISEVGGFDEQKQYAIGNMTGQLDSMYTFGKYFDFNMKELAREYAEENDLEPFGGIPEDEI